jgi:hypothetical protein
MSLIVAVSSRGGLSAGFANDAIWRVDIIEVLVVEVLKNVQ